MGAGVLGNFGMFGIEMVPNSLLADRRQTRFPKSKSRRIRRKWTKRQSNWSMVPRMSYYMMGNQLIAHPSMIEKILRAIGQRNSINR